MAHKFLMVTGLCSVLGAMATISGCAVPSENDLGQSEARLMNNRHWRSGDPHHIVVWNKLANQLDTTGNINRTWALVHLSQFDAVNSIGREFHPYKFQVDAAAGASREAAAVQAAYRILIRRYTTAAQQTTINTQYGLSMAEIPDGQAKTDGQAVGDQVANQLYDDRATDGYNVTNLPYDPAVLDQPGKPLAEGPQFYSPWTGVAADGTLTKATAINGNAANWRPFAMTSASQFRADPPRDITSGAWAKDFNETKTYGAACPDPNDCARDADQSAMALFFIETPAPLFGRVSRSIVTNEGLDIYDAARFFALLSLANVDGVQSVFETKWVYRGVRPITAIRNAASDGNNRTEADTAWTPFMVTPPHGEYPAAHTWISNSMLIVLRSFFGRDYAFDATNAAGTVTRHYASFDALGDESFLARIYGGMHFRKSLQVGEHKGKEVGRFVVETQLTPVSGESLTAED